MTTDATQAKAATLAACSNANELAAVEEAAVSVQTVLNSDSGGREQCASVCEMASGGDESGEKPKEAEDELVAQQQAARSYLRQQFLRCMAGLSGHAATFHMYEKTTVKGTYRCFDADIENFGVCDLDTVLGRYPAVTLRAGDVISFTVNLDVTGDSNGH